MSKNQILKITNNVKKLPSNGKKIFIKAYNNSNSIESAWGVVSQKYKPKNDSFVLTNSVGISAVLNKEGFFSPTFYYEPTLSSTSIDDHGQKVSEGLLKRAITKRMIEDEGDILHFGNKGIRKYNGLYKLRGCRYDDENKNLKIKIILDKNHSEYKTALKMHKKYPMLGLSAEFFNPIVVDDEIVDCDSIGWSVLPNPSLKKTLFKTKQ